MSNAPMALLKSQSRKFGPAGDSCSGSCPEQNISDMERVASLGGGALLTVLGLSRGGLSGLLASGLGAGLLYRGMTAHCHAYEMLGIDTSEHNSATAVPAKAGVHVERTIAINRPAAELYAFWRKLDNLPIVLKHIKRIEVREDGKSHWVADAPLGAEISWDAEVFNEREPEMIAWRSLPGSTVETAGSIHFRDLGNGRGTSVEVTMKYNPPGGQLGDMVASFLGSGLEQQLDSDLKRFKQHMEAGEVPTVEGQPSGRV